MIENLDPAQVYEEFQPLIRRFVLSRCHDETFADHVTADVFANLLEQLAKGKGPHTNIRSYLYQSALHEIVNQSRRDQRSAPLEVAAGHIGADSRSLELGIDANALKAAMKAHLTDRQSEVIFWSIIHNLSRRETAETLGITENNVKVIQSRALSKLKAGMAAQLKEEKGFRMNFNLKDCVLVPLSDIQDNPYQAREEFDQLGLVGLATSIKEFGLLQIPVARKAGNQYQMAFGHRRRMAFELLAGEGWKTFEQMPLYVREIDDQEMFEISLSENIKRKDFNPIEKATALKQYMQDFGATSAQAAKLFGMAQSSVRQAIRYLNLPPEAQQELSAGKMTTVRARELLAKPERKRRTDSPDPEAGNNEFDLREQLSILLYGARRTDVSDQVLFTKIKRVFQENEQLRHQVDVMNRKSLSVSKLKGYKVTSSSVEVETESAL